MAAKKEEVKEKLDIKPKNKEDKIKLAEQAILQIEKQFGKGAIMKMGERRHEKVDVIPTGCLVLDYALGIGGVPKGRIIEIYGPESSGKTTVSLHIIAQAQKLGGMAAFIDAEHALDPVYAENLGVNLENLESFKAQDLEVFNQKQILNDVTQSKFIESEKSNSQTSMYVTQNDKAGTGTSQNPQSSSVTLNAQSTLEKIKNSLEGSKPQALQKAALHLGAGSVSVEQANLKTQANVNVQKAQNLNTNAQNVESVEESLDLFNIFTPQEEGILSGTVSKEGTLNSSSSLTQALNLLNPALSRLNSLSAQGGMAQNFNSQSSLNGNSQSALTQALHQSLNISQDVDENTQNVTQMVMAMAARNLKSLTIDLNPSSLGQMTISLALSSKGTPLKVSVDAKNLSTKNLISKMLPKLNDSLQERGFGAKVSLVDSSASKASLWSELFA